MAYEALEQAIQDLKQTNDALVQTVQDKWSSANSAATLAEQSAADASASEASSAAAAAAAEAQAVLAAESKDAAALSEASAATAVLAASESQAGAMASKLGAEAAASAADASAAAAAMSLDAIQLSDGVYATAAAGLAATTDGAYFSVPSAESAEYLILYKNNAGVASEVKRYPSSTLVSQLASGQFTELGIQLIELAPETGMIWGVQDAAGRVVGINSSGEFTGGIAGFPAPEEIYQLASGQFTELGIQLIELAPETGMIWGVQDAAGRVVGINSSGEFTGGIAGFPAPEEIYQLANGQFPAINLDMENLAAEAGFIFAVRDPAGRAVGFKNNGNFSGGIDGAVSVLSVTGSDGQPFIPLPRVSCWGDSMTAGAGYNYAPAGYPYPTTLATLLGREVLNFGVGGTTSEQIACRQGAILMGVTLSGGQIPASGAVTITAWTVDPYNDQTTQTRAGTLAGIHGTLTRVAVVGTPGTTDYYTFTRDASGSVVTVADGTPFIFDDAVNHISDTVVIWAGRNDPRSTRSEIIAIRDNVLAMVGHLSAVNKRFLVLPVSNMRVEEGTGTAIYDGVIATNNELRETFGSNYADLRAYMVNRAIYDAGITPTADDLTDIAADSVPRSLQSFTSHYNGAGYEQVAKFVYRQIISRGW